MPSIRTALLTCFTLLATLLLPAAGWAEEERWYRVELLVFSHEGESSASSERWAATPELAYPGASRFLVEPQRVEQNIQRYLPDGEVQSEVDKYGRQFITVIDPDDESLPAIGERPAIEPGADTTSALDPQEITDLPRPAIEELLTPTPFVTLPASARDFHGKAAYMQRSGYYQTLFHQSWLQPVGAERNALPVVLDRSGDTQQWPRLQGSIRLHLSRYLHLETNLWLNTSGDYLPGQWRMPAPPLGPPSLVVEAPEPELEDFDLAATEAATVDEEGESALPLLEQAPEETGPVYPWRHAVLLQQKRRMRSAEVHYLDHPLLGVVIQLTPLDEDYLHAMALAEQALDQSQ